MPKGINRDLSPFELPPEMWSDGNNVNFRRMRTNSTLGYSNPFSLEDAEVSPTYLQYFTDNIDPFWLYCGDTGTGSRVYKTDGATATEVSTTEFTITRDASWSGCNFNSLVVLNARSEHPQVLPYPYTTLVDMPNWGSTAWPAASRCEVIRPYKNYLIAMDCYDDIGTRYANMVRWSSPAQQGDVPDSWDPEDPASSAGLYNLADTPGRIVDGLTLGDYFVIYKSDAVWVMQFIGGTFTMKFRKLFGDEAGALNKDCIAEFEGKHFVLGPAGAYIHNGSSKEEIMDNWVKDELFLNINPDYRSDVRVAVDHNNGEIWVYYVSTNTSLPYADKALIWNWREAIWTKRDLQDASFIAEGYVDPNGTGVDGWDSDSGTWDEALDVWDGEISFNSQLKTLLIANYTDQKFYANEYVSGTDKFFPQSFVKRIGIDMNDDRSFKLVTRIVPHIQSANPVNVTIFMSDVQTPSPTIAATAIFRPGIDEDIDCHCVGRYIGIQFESSSTWTLNGYTIEWKRVGKY